MLKGSLPKSKRKTNTAVNQSEKRHGKKLSRISWKGGALLAPIPPVLVTCKSNEKENVFTVAWTGILGTIPPKTYISVRQKRFSYNLIKESGEFVINLAPSALAKEVDYCGIYTGAKVDKFEKCKLTRVPSEKVDCPTIAECPLAIECRVTDIVPMGSHDMFVADIVSVSVDRSVIDKKGKLDIGTAKLLAFAHGEYFELGKRVGEFGFSARKKKHTKKPRQAPAKNENKHRKG